MKRRDFVSRVTLGGVVVACTGFGKPAHARAASQVNVRFVGMMTFIERSDRSFLVATPGQHARHHMVHTPFLMARAGSAVAKAFDMKPARGVVPEAFDTMLVGSNPSEFVYRRLDNTALDITSGGSAAVTNHADEMAMLNRIAPNKRLRGNVEKWASSTISLRGGSIENSEGHPDAHKVWTFGSHRQRVTDAINFTTPGATATTIRLTSATEARSFTVPAGEAAGLWVISAAQPGESDGNPTMLEHSEVMFEYLVDATPVVATCPEATGRVVPPTELPFANATSASNGIIASGSVVPPWSEFCWVTALLIGRGNGK
jgi:hypothetical protein